MKKISLLITILFLGISINAQEIKAPKYKLIEKNVKEVSSEFYYPNLMDKYKKGENLKPEEQRHLYYGYIFQPNYSAVDTSSHNASLLQVLSKKSFTKNDYNNILSQAEILLKQDPFNIRALNAELFVYAQQDNVDAYKRVINQRKNVFDAILSSGDGSDVDNAFYVIKVSHEYDLLGLFGYKYDNEEKIIKKRYNYLKIGENKYGLDKIYFEITPVLEYMRNNPQK